MKFHTGDEVVIVSDSLGLDLPINSSAIVTNIDRSVDELLHYLIRIPAKRKSVWVCERDIEFSEIMNARDADNAIAYAMRNHALDTGNRELFDAYCDR